MMGAMTPDTDTRSRILDTAREMFHGRSYADVGIQEICDGARVQKGSFYHFFPSKRDLALAVIDNMADEWAHGFVAESFDLNLPPVERLDYMIDAAYYWQKASTDLEGRIGPDGSVDRPFALCIVRAPGAPELLQTLGLREGLRAIDSLAPSLAAIAPASGTERASPIPPRAKRMGAVTTVRSSSRDVRL